MNYLDAHKIVNEYAGMFAQKKCDAIVGCSIRSIPFYCENWQDKLVVAAQIYASHAILWNSATEKQINALFGLLAMDVQAVEHEEYLRRKSLWNIIEKSTESTVYKKFNKKKIAKAAEKLLSKEIEVGSIDGDTVGETFNHMLYYKNNVFLPRYFEAKENDWKVISFEQLVCDYCVETYAVSKIKWKQEYEIYFYKFEQMRNWINEGKNLKYLAPYKEYIFTFE